MKAEITFTEILMTPKIKITTENDYESYFIKKIFRGKLKQTSEAHKMDDNGITIYFEADTLEGVTTK